MSYIAEALLSLVPNSQFAVTGNVYEGIEWHDERELPSKNAVEVELARLQADYDSKQYQRQRQPEYPSLAELADAIYWASTGDTTRIDAYYAACAAVKAKYPKPEVTQ